MGSLLHLSPTDRRAPLLLLQGKSLCSKLRPGTKALGMAPDTVGNPRSGDPTPSLPRQLPASALAMLITHGDAALRVSGLLLLRKTGWLASAPRLLARPWRVSGFHSELGGVGTHLSHPPGAHQPAGRRGGSAKLRVSPVRFSLMEISAPQPALHRAGSDRARRRQHLRVWGCGGGRRGLRTPSLAQGDADSWGGMEKGGVRGDTETGPWERRKYRRRHAGGVPVQPGSAEVKQRGGTEAASRGLEWAFAAEEATEMVCRQEELPSRPQAPKCSREGGYRADLKPRGCPTHRKQHLQAAPHRPPIQTHLLLSTPLPQHPSCLTPGHGRAIRAQHCENSTSHTQTSPVKRFDPTCAVQNTARPPVLHAGQMKASALLGLCSSKQSTSACQALSLSLILHQPHTAQVLLWRHGCHHSPTQPFCPSSTHPPPPLQAGIVCHAKHGGPKESEGAREKCKDNFRHPVHQEEQGSCIFSGRS